MRKIVLRKQLERGEKEVERNREFKTAVAMKEVERNRREFKTAAE